MARPTSLPRRLLQSWRTRFAAQRRAPEAGPGLPLTLSLHDLPLAVLDTETTGLNPARDRIVSIGGLHWRGERAEGALLDLLLHPGRRIPASATAIHGIDDAMVATAPPFALVSGTVQGFWRHRVLLGHNIGFDLALLREEAARARIGFQPPSAALDIGLLYAGLHPRSRDCGIEAIAAQFGVAIEGRHSATGDAETAAKLWCALRPQLIGHGIGTLGGAQAVMRRARDLIDGQQRAGWAIDLVLPHD